MHYQPSGHAAGRPLTVPLGYFPQPEPTYTRRPSRPSLDRDHLRRLVEADALDAHTAARGWQRVNRYAPAAEFLAVFAELALAERRRSSRCLLSPFRRRPLGQVPARRRRRRQRHAVTCRRQPSGSKGDPPPDGPSHGRGRSC